MSAALKFTVLALAKASLQSVEILYARVASIELVVVLSSAATHSGLAILAVLRAEQLGDPVLFLIRICMSNACFATFIVAVMHNHFCMNSRFMCTLLYFLRFVALTAVSTAWRDLSKKGRRTL